MPVGKLQNDGQAGTADTFPARTVRWVRFTVDAVRPGTEGAGLGEMEVYAAHGLPVARPSLVGGDA